MIRDAMVRNSGFSAEEQVLNERRDAENEEYDDENPPDSHAPHHRAVHHPVVHHVLHVVATLLFWGNVTFACAFLPTSSIGPQRSGPDLHLCSFPISA